VEKVVENFKQRAENPGVEEWDVHGSVKQFSGTKIGLLPMILDPTGHD